MTGVLLQLSGRYAVGQYAHAIVDEDLLPELSRYKWKAKPNARRTHVYAVRNVVVDGVNKTIRLHRHVLGYFGPRDVAHGDHDTMNNQRGNLRVVTRSETVRNGARPQRVARARVSKPKAQRSPRLKPVCTCRHCGVVFTGEKHDQQFCTQSCRKKAKLIRQKKAGTLPPSKQPCHPPLGSSSDVSRTGPLQRSASLVASGTQGG